MLRHSEKNGDIRLQDLEEKDFSLWNPVNYTHIYKVARQKVNSTEQETGKQLNYDGKIQTK